MTALAELQKRLDEGGVLLLDGPNGTELERRGATMDTVSWCGQASVENYELLRGIHADYLDIGCDVITTNTYAGSRLMLEAAGLADRVAEVTESAVRAAREAASALDRPAIIAGSLSHVIPFEAGTSRTAEDHAPDTEHVRRALTEMAGLLRGSGCDIILVEMMYHPERARLAMEAALKSGLPVWVTFAAREGADGELLSYFQEEAIVLERLLDDLPIGAVHAAGINHTRADLMGRALRAVRERFDGPLIAYPDSGHFEMPNWNFRDVMSVEDFRRYVQEWVRDGVQIVGGCCGLSPEHIEAIADLRSDGSAPTKRGAMNDSRA